MKIILTENQLSNTIIKFIKKEGWEKTCQMLGLSREEFAEMFFNNNPMEFLNIFNDLDIIQDKINPNDTLFRNEKGNNIMIYNRKKEIVYISYEDIWVVLKDGFGLNNNEAQELTERWLSEVYNLRGFKLAAVGLV
jgi:hypothetical protein